MLSALEEPAERLLERLLEVLDEAVAGADQAEAVEPALAEAGGVDFGGELELSIPLWSEGYPELSEGGDAELIGLGPGARQELPDDGASELRLGAGAAAMLPGATVSWSLFWMRWALMVFPSDCGVGVCGQWVDGGCWSSESGSGWICRSPEQLLLPSACSKFCRWRLKAPWLMLSYRSADSDG